MSGANTGTIPLAEVANVIVELAKQKKTLDDLNEELRRQKRRSEELWRDTKGDEFREKADRIIRNNACASEAMQKQLDVMSDYYKKAWETQRQTQFD